MREILSAIPTFNKLQWFLLGIMLLNVVFQTIVIGRSWKRVRKCLDSAENLYIQAMEDTKELRMMKTFADTIFCACESCKDRECPYKLTRLTIADAVRMGVPIRVGNFMGDCSGYTEEDE